MDDRPLSIGIDARAASHPQPGGFKSYVTNLIHALARTDHTNHYQLYTDRPTGLDAGSFGPRFSVKVVQSRIPLIGPVWREQALLPVAARAERLDVMHLPASAAPIWRAVPTVVTLHDAIEHMPEQATGTAAWATSPRRQLMRLYNRQSQKVAARTAHLVVAPSHSAARDISTYLGIPKSRLRVVPEAPGAEFKVLRAPCELTFLGTDEVPFILAVGSADPRKNLGRLIDAYAAQPAAVIASYRLVIVWTHALLQEELINLARQRGVADRITSVPAPTNDLLCRLYNRAAAFVFPSLYEGFGLPPLEAMACGTPVIASNTSALPEVLGEAALLVDPRSTHDLVQALDRLLSDLDLRRELSARGLAHVTQFSWERSAAQTRAVYEEAVALTRPPERN